MTQKAFCYHCRIHHPVDQMVAIPTRRGPRLRCLKTVKAAQRSQAERDAFGRARSEANQADARRQAEIANLLRRGDDWIRLLPR